MVGSRDAEDGYKIAPVITSGELVDGLDILIVRELTGGVALDVFAGLFIVLFSTYFFCAEGERIWRWLVRLAPRAARRSRRPAALSPAAISAIP